MQLNFFDANLTAARFDCDGDGGKPDTVQDLQTRAQFQWKLKGWRPYLIQGLRKAFGDELLIYQIANSAGAMPLPGLNGVTIAIMYMSVPHHSDGVVRRIYANIKPLTD